MAKKMATRETNGRLEEALATLINEQALFVGQMARMDDRFARIENELGEIKTILLHHQRALEKLPEAIVRRLASQNRDSFQSGPHRSTAAWLSSTGSLTGS